MNEKLGIREYSAAIMLPLLIVGIIGNMLSIFVYSRTFMRKNAVGFLLLCLSISDLIVLLTSLPIFSYYKFPYAPGKGKLGSWHSRICAFSLAYLYPTGACAKMISQYIILIVSIERWFAVCRPLEVHIWCTIRIAVKYLLIVILLSIIFNISRFFEYEADLDKGTINPRLSHSKNGFYFTFFTGAKSIVFDALVPFLTLSVTNVMVIRQLNKSSEERRSMTSQKHKEATTTTMLLVMILVYAVTHFLNTFIKFVNVIVLRRYGQHGSLVILYLHNISNILIVGYTTSTFFIYLIFSIKFRLVIVAIFTCKSYDELNSTSNRATNRNSKS